MRSVKFDGIRVAELSVSFMEASALLTAKAAFVNTRTGDTHGWTTGRRWSAATLEKLSELRASMERDLEGMHFEDGALTPVAGNEGLPAAFKGLGERYTGAGDEVQQG